MAVPIKMILKEIGSRINNIGTIVDTDPNNDETTSYAGKMNWQESCGTPVIMKQNYWRYWFLTRRPYHMMK